MGHVDHGKSTLLDFIRKANVVAGEAGGITQHVAAYDVTHKDKRITFIDTPGHAAFSAIRARGANVADIAILVVAADDGVKAQTLEALQQIRDAKIPFIVAINKIDKPNADLSRTQGSLLEKEVYLETLGGDVPWAAISAKSGQGVDELLDLILLVTEMQEFRADASGAAEGYVIEAHRDQKRGIAATLIITSGTLESGMAVLVGRAVAPVRIMENHLGKSIKEATFSTPVTLGGFDELPAVGERFTSFRNKKLAEDARNAIQKTAPTVSATTTTPAEDCYYLPLIVRADTTGSLEAIVGETMKIGDEHARLSIVQSGIGSISENDIKAALAGTNKGVVVGFNVSTDRLAEALSRQNAVQVENFNIIYKLTERLAELLKSSAPTREVEEVKGRAKVLKQFSKQKDLTTVGGKVSEGFIQKNGRVRITRRNVALGDGKVISVQTNKQTVDRVDAENEFGMQIESSFEVAQGDVIEYVVTSKV